MPVEEFNRLDQEVHNYSDIPDSILAIFQETKNKVADYRQKIKMCKSKAEIDALEKEIIRSCMVDFTQEITDRKADFMLGKRKADGEEESLGQKRQKSF